MPGKCCGKSGGKSKKVRAHTPIMSRAQRGAFGASYSAKKSGKAKPAKTPASIWQIPMGELKSHLSEAGGKKLPKKAKKRK